MNRNWVYSLFALWIVCSFACTQPKPVANVEVQKENFVFSIKGTDTLSLDKYELPSISPALKKPVMIFAFGGGFKGEIRRIKDIFLFRVPRPKRICGRFYGLSYHLEESGSF